MATNMTQWKVIQRTSRPNGNLIFLQGGLSLAFLGIFILKVLAEREFSWVLFLPLLFTLFLFVRVPLLDNPLKEEMRKQSIEYLLYVGSQLLFWGSFFYGGYLLF
jgi:hypothetical protein